MKLKTAIFYQSVKNWDNNESNTFKADPTQIIELEDHLVKVSKEGRKEVIIVPTANLRYAIADYMEAYPVNSEIVLLSGKPLGTDKITEDFEKVRSGELVKPEEIEEPKLTLKKKANAKQ